MKNNYTSLKSPIDEEDELKTGHEIDLEKGLLPEYDSEEEGALPPYSDHAHVNNTPYTHRENHSSGTAENSSTSPLKKAFLSFIPIFVLNVPAVCYLTYKAALFKDYGKDEWVYFGVWCASCLMIFISLWLFYETWTEAVKHFLKKWRNVPMAFAEVLAFNIIIGGLSRMNLRYIFGDRWGFKCSLADHIIFAILSILVFIAETVEPGSIRVNLIRKMGYKAKQQVNECTAVPLRDMNPESEA
uniref:Cw10b n=1 Tax=Schizosaccharomyces pombe TaxID=4896 RepID=A0A1X9Q9F7_SCHPM|nr:cw10b [Schizosaccharomyces pombe]